MCRSLWAVAVSFSSHPDLHNDRRSILLRLRSGVVQRRWNRSTTSVPASRQDDITEEGGEYRSWCVVGIPLRGLVGCQVPGTLPVEVY